MPKRYVDLQVNGFAGIDFNNPQTPVADILRATSLLTDLGIESYLPTIITAAPATMVACITNIVIAARELGAGGPIEGIHIEGPFFSDLPGYIGAHPPQHASVADLDLLSQLLKAGDGLVRLVTLAPEIDTHGALTRACRSEGVAVAAGHTNASWADLERCIDAGLGLFTHLGNGCPNQMDRHDNILTRALHFRECLHYSLIADGFHIPDFLFQQWLQLIPNERVLVVSDAISAAGLGPGTYPLGDRTVTIGADGAARDPIANHFVGSASSMRDADRWLSESLGLGEDSRRQLLYENAKGFLRSHR